MKTLLLHIGVKKTGSTSIQHLLAHNNPFGDRVLYPTSGRLEGGVQNNHRQLARAIRKKPGSAEGCWDQLFRELDQTSAEVVVLSAEGFSSCRDDEVESLRHRLRGLDVRVLVYLRNPLDFMASGFAQAVKRGRYAARFRDYMNRDERIARCNYAALMDRWIGAWGRERVQMRIYDKVATSLLEDFLAQIPVPHTPIGDPAPRNVSPPAHVIDLLRYVNRLEGLGTRAGVPAELFSRVRRSLREKRGPGGPVRSFHKRASRRSRVYARRDVEYLRGAVEGWMEDFLGRYVAAEDRHYFDF